MCEHDFVLLRRFNKHTSKIGCVICDSAWLLDTEEDVVFDWVDELFNKLYQTPDITALEACFSI